MKKLLLLFCLSLSLLFSPAQSTQNRVQQILTGHWKGAFIKSNAAQKIKIEFLTGPSTGKFFALQMMEEWYPQFGDFATPVEIDSAGRFSFNTGLGKVNMVLDTNYLEILGHVEGSDPTLNLHLKKVPTPPAPSYKVEEIRIQNGDISLFGHLHSPKNGPFKTAMIIVGGRGCYAGETEYDLYAKVLREYGVSVWVFHKRGTGQSSGDCQTATMEDLASDVRACHKFLKSHPHSFQHIGILGSSAGGWVMAKAEEAHIFDFMIGIVGPSTSVKTQQLQSMAYGLDFYDLSEVARQEIMEYTDLMFEAKANQKSFDRFQELLKGARQNGWIELLDDTDVPASPTGIDSLWVRRHSYDPGPSLKAFDKPMLSIYGQTDWIVPYEENIARLKEELFVGERAKLLKTVVAYASEHGTEAEGKYVNLENNKSYWHFYRISPQVLIEIIQFLRKNNWIEG